MKDLTKIKLPLGMLSKKTQKRLKEAFEAGDVVEWWTGGGWAVKEHGSTLYTDFTYRKQPAPEPTQDELDWSHVSDDIVAIARHEGLTHSWLYSKAPTSFSSGQWVGGWSLSTTLNFASYKRGTCEAKDSLVLRPRGE